MNLKIESISLEGHALQVPEGLSELLNNNNGWAKKEIKSTLGYSREIVKRDGKLITKLTKRKG